MSSSIVYSIRPAWRMEWPWVLKIVIVSALFFSPNNRLPQQVIQPLFSNFLSSVGLSQGDHDWLHTAGVFLISYFLIRAAWSHYQHRYLIDAQGVEHQLGIMSRDEKRIDFCNVTLVNMQQSFFSRIFGIGDVLIGTSATDQPEIAIQGVSNPRHWKNEIHVMQRDAKHTSRSSHEY